MRVLASIAAAGLMIMGFAACGSATTNGSGQAPDGAPLQAVANSGSITDQAGFIEALRGAGVEVANLGDTEQSIFSVPGARLSLSGGDLSSDATIEVYEYADTGAAQKDANQIDPDGSTSTVQVDWVDAPHFYRAGRVLVLYVGSDSAVTQLITNLTGPQFTGR